MEISWTVTSLCQLLGFTPQAHYQALVRADRRALEAALVLSWVKDEREDLPKLGGRKLYHKLSARLEAHQILMGRDRLFDLLRETGLLIRRTRRRHFTTNSNHPFWKYPNLIIEFVPNAPHQLWVGDITYLKVARKYYYLSLITDAYSRKIVGYALGKTLETVHNMAALHMALKQLPPSHQGLIHHSDRGIQYCSNDYTEELNAQRIAISMTQNGDPLENPIAERINGILKDELLDLERLNSFKQTQQAVDKAVFAYNTLRPHMSIDLLTPEVAHQRSGPLKRRWKNYYTQKP